MAAHLYVCGYPWCTAELRVPVVDDGPGAVRRARCDRHTLYTWDCPRCRLYSDRLRRGVGGWPGCPACGGSGYTSLPVVVRELADAVRGHRDGRRRLLQLLHDLADGFDVVFDVDDDRIHTWGPEPTPWVDLARTPPPFRAHVPRRGPDPDPARMSLAAFRTASVLRVR